jgi:hypothetical protein
LSVVVRNFLDVPAPKNDPWANDLARLRRLEQREAALAAERATVLSRMVSSTSGRDLGWDGDAPFDSLIMEVADTARVGQRAANSRLFDSEHLVQRLPRTHAALAAGTLFVPQARVIVQETRDLSADLCAKVEAAIVPTAARYTAGDLRRRVQRAVIAVDPGDAQQRHERAKDDRGVDWQPRSEGMVALQAEMTAVQGRRFDTDLTALLGRTTVAPDDVRTETQRRLDLLADLPGLALEALDRLHGVLPPLGIPSLLDAFHADSSTPVSTRSSRRRRRRTQVVIEVPVATAVGLTDGPVHLDGYGWITAQQGLALIPHAELRHACVDTTGRMVHLGEPTTPAGDGGVDAMLRRMATAPVIVSVDDASQRVEPHHDPSEALREFVELRDRRCDGPGCSTPAHASDLDHRIPWPAGPTSAANLDARSERCHQAKHHGWTVTVDRDGVSTWTSPAGRRYQRWPAYEPPPMITDGRRRRPLLRPPRRPQPSRDDEAPPAPTQP